MPNKTQLCRRSSSCLWAVSLTLILSAVLVRPGETCAAEPPTTAAGASAAKIEFTQDTLPNGLRVIYAPLHQAPVVQVRVLYHVGSRDERADRQGFAHMFEHMMFRGSAHVAPEEHMKLIGVAGGISNAFTSFDQTVYHDTLPANHLDMALYLEADRMASFKVSEEIYKTERKVVAEEWRMRMNRPYGSMFEDFLRSAFTTHSYRWTPIGNMDHLRAARVNELQEFFNRYYVPNNATLVIAGDFDIAEARKAVEKYYGWIPAGPKVEREVAAEPAQEAARRAIVPSRVPLPAVMVGWHTPLYSSDDHEALSLLADVLGGGQSSRLERLLVTGDKPQAVRSSAQDMRLEDAGVFSVDAIVMQGRNPDAVEKALVDTVADVVAHGVTPEELEKAKTQERMSLIQGRETATELAAQIGEEALFGGDPARVNTALARLDAVTVDQIQAVARKYLRPELSTTLRIVPDPLGKSAKDVATQASMDVAIKPSTRPVTPRDVEFPKDYPAHAALNDTRRVANFQKGEESEIGGVRVIVMSDTRLPLVSWSLTTRSGSGADPAGKEGLSSLADQMLRRGSAGVSFAQLNEDLESRAIQLGVSDGFDFTRLTGSCTTPQLDHAMQRTREVLTSPDFPVSEFKKLQEQVANELQLAQENPMTVAGNDLDAALYGAQSPLGRAATPASVSSVTLDEVKSVWRRNVRPKGAILLIAGDVSVDRGRELARQLLDGWKDAGDAVPTTAAVATTLPSARRVILVDRPGGKQATVRLGIRAYNIQTPDKFAGSIAGQILTAGIDSRLGRYVRAQKGLAYTVHGVFQPTRYSGAFVAGTETAVESTADAVDAIIKVLNDMRSADVTADELTQAKSRVAGSMVMSMQTIQQQAALRVDGILNGYPLDYYDTYAERIGRTTTAEIRSVMNKYVIPDEMVIVVVAPADVVRTQLDRLGKVEVVPMPAKRDTAATQPSQELLKPATAPQ